VVANERTQKAESPRIQYIYDVNQKKIIKKWIMSKLWSHLSKITYFKLNFLYL
jgi:hypothetical protein